MTLRVPGDKSITQRALILASLAEGTSVVSGLLAGEDPRSTAAALRALGAQIPELPSGGEPIRIRGRGLRGLSPPAHTLDLGNSGTGARLLLGVLAGQPFSAAVTGDASLRARPMKRVTDPLEVMGGRFESLGEEGRLPIRVHGGSLQPVELSLPVASAQVKSALLLAGLVSGSFVLLTEPGRSRDHTERMLRAFGASVVEHAGAGGWRVELRDPPGALAAQEWAVPGDFSSAAFFLALGALGGGGDELVLDGVGLNPTRTGFLEILKRMGAKVETDPAESPEAGREPSGRLAIAPAALRGITMDGEDVLPALDEVPLIAVLACRAEGTTRITGAGELRVKETDRIAALVRNLRAVGARAEEFEDGMEIEGSDAPLTGRIEAFHDHRIAMAFGILGALPGNQIEVDDPDVVAVSYPDFWKEVARVSSRAPGAPAGP